jgi:hypothetical protein
MTAPKPKPCPQCGNIYVELYAYENGWKHVECDECYYLGPGEGSKLAAIQSHNKSAAEKSA